jgi:hypothetical protein
MNVGKTGMDDKNLNREIELVVTRAYGESGAQSESMGRAA